MKSGKKGFTIVEIVIALALIAIVSLTATTIVLSGQSIQKRSSDKFFAVNFCNNSIAVFQSAVTEATNVQNDEDDKDTLTGIYNSFTTKINLLGVKLPDELTDFQTIVYFNGNWQQIKVTESDSAKFECILSFKVSEVGNTVTLELLVNSNKETELYSTSYLMAIGGQA